MVRAHLVEEAAVDLVDDFQVTGEHRAEERQRPLLQRLRQQGVVRVPARPLGNRPRRIPVHEVLVDQQAHQLGDGDGRMRVVQLRSPMRIEVRESLAAHQVQANHVLQRAGDEEVLLLQP